MEKKGPAFKPQLLVCYLCGQQFGTASLGIHVPQCYDKKLAQWEAGDPSTRGKQPKHPDTVDWQKNNMSVEERNDAQYQEFSNNLEPCPNCGRKFLADRLVVHLRSCNPSNSGGGSKPIRGKEGDRPKSQSGEARPGTSGSGGGGEKKGPAFKPQLLVCYLCGQQFGTASLGIHVPQCYDKKLAQWEAGDPSTRGKQPKHPDTVDWQKNNMSVEERNDAQYQEFSNNLEPCPNCGRKFLADRLVVHLRSCKPGSGSKPPVREVSPQPPSREVSSTNGSQSGNGRLGPSAPQQSSQASRQSNPPPPAPRDMNSGPVPKKLPPKLRALQRILFEDCDVNKDGKIDLQELRQMVRSVAGDDSAKDAEELMASLDLNGDGVIDPSEWAKMATATGESLQPLRNRVPTGTPSSKGRPCRKCKAVEHDDKAKFCKDCGTAFDATSSQGETGTCAQCHESYPIGSRFCPTCGTPVNGAGAAERDAGEVNQNTMSMRMEPCPSCRAMCDSETNFCDNCGAVLGNQDDDEEFGDHGAGSHGVCKMCEPCGLKYDDPEAKFCEECGGQLKDASPKGNKRWNESRLEATQLPKVRGGGQPSTPPPGPSSRQQAPARSNASPQRPPVAQPRFEAPPDVDDDGDDSPDNRVGCKHCGRLFNSDVVARHENVCQRHQNSSRKIFDSTKARLQGTDAQSYLRKIKSGDSGESKQVPKKDWKAESEAFRRALREARVVDQVLKAGGTAKDLPPPTYSENAHYVPCPHCGRKFARDVAERHIPKCATTINKPKAPPKRR